MDRCIALYPHGSFSSQSKKTRSHGFECQIFATFDRKWLDALQTCQFTLERLGVHFCESCIDSNFMLAELGKALPELNVLDIRGRSGVNSITPFLNARAGREEHEDEEDFGEEDVEINDSRGKRIFILARYSNISKNSLEESNAIHPGTFECVIDSGGTGRGITRYSINFFVLFC